MSFHPIDTEPFHVGYTVLAAFIVIFGMFSLLLKERLYIGEAVWATVFGIIVGPYCAKIFDPREWATRNSVETNTVTLEVTRIVLAVGVFAIGVELPKAYVGRHWKSLTFLLAPIMVYGWFVCGALIYSLVPRLDFLTSLAIAACLTPTDPILAAAVVGGRFAEKHVPTHLRHLLAAESGVNDGAAFPMLFISLYLILERSEATAVAKWFYITWVYEIILGTVLGALLGYGFRHLMKFCERRDLIDRQSYVAQYVSLALLSNGIANILGSDDLLASFACGTAFAYDGWFNRKTEESMFSNVIDLLFNCACFIYIGAWIPFKDFNNPVLELTPWRLLVISLLVILLRRLPIMLALYRWIPEVKTLREAVFSGHFGPIGVGAIFISTYALDQIPGFKVQAAGRSPESQLELLAATIQPIVSFIVLVSIAIHGLSIPFFSLSRRVHSISRTWSRHTSMDPTGLPEWTTHTRRVARGEEIVINRDPEPLDVVQKMERGDLERDITMTPSTLSAGAEDNVDLDGVTERDGVAVRSNRSDEGRPRSPYVGSDADSARTRNSIELTLRAGDTSEWREGPDLIIERTVGDNEEVTVEIVPNAFYHAKGDGSEVVQNAANGLREHVAHGLEEVKNLEHDLKARFALMPSRREGDKNDEKPNDSSNHDIQNANDWSQDVERIQAESHEGLRHDHPRRASRDDNVDATEDDPDYNRNNDDEDMIDPPSRDGPSPRHSRSMVPKPLEKKYKKSPKSSLGTSLRRRLFGPGHERPRVHSGTASPSRAASIRPDSREGNRDGAEGDQGTGMPGELSLEGSQGSPSHPPSPIMDRSPPPTPGTFGTASPSNLHVRSRSVSRDEGTQESPPHATLPSAAVLRQRLSLHLIGADRPGYYGHAHDRSESPGGRSIRFVGDDASHVMPRGGHHRHQHLHYTHRPTSSGSAKSGRLVYPPGALASLPHSGSMPLVASGTGYGNVNNDVEEGSRGVTFDLPPRERRVSSESPSTTTPPTPSSKRA